MDVYRTVMRIIGVLFVTAFLHVTSSRSASCDLPGNVKEFCRVDTNNVLHCNISNNNQTKGIPGCVTQLHLCPKPGTPVNLNWTSHGVWHLQELVIDPLLCSNDLKISIRDPIHLPPLPSLLILRLRSSNAVSNIENLLHGSKLLRVLDLSRYLAAPSVGLARGLTEVTQQLLPMKVPLIEKLILKNVQTSKYLLILLRYELGALLCQFQFLQYLDLTYNEISYLSFSMFYKNLTICGLNLKYLDISHNQIGHLYFMLTTPNILHMLEVLNFSNQGSLGSINDWTNALYRNDVTGIQDLNAFAHDKGSASLEYHRNILNDTTIPCPYNSSNIHIHNFFQKNRQPIFTLKSLDVSNINTEVMVVNEWIARHLLFGIIKGGVCFGANHLEKIDASFHPVRINLNMSYPPSIGLNHLRYLNLYGIEHHFDTLQLVETLPALQYLNLGKNRLTIRDHECLNSSNLQFLDLSSSELKHLPRDYFLNLPRLEHLNFSHSDIELDGNGITLKNCPLRFLSLRSTSLQVLSPFMRQQIDTLKGVEVDLRDNPLSCRCEDIDFIEWVLENKNSINFTSIASYICYDHNGPNFILNLDLSTLKWQCNDNAKIVVSVIVTLTVVSLVLGIYITYKKRWHLRYFFFHLQEKRKKEVDPTLEAFEYDAFILYSSIDEDRLWVHYELRAELEDKYGFKLCIHHRDFLAGNYIIDNVEEAIHNSRKVIAVISPNFVDSEWCSAELHATNSVDHNKLILLMFSDITQCPNVEALLRHFLSTKTYLEWEHKDDKAKEIFWAKIVKALYAK